MIKRWGLPLLALSILLVVSAVALPLEQILVHIQQWALEYPALAAGAVGTLFFVGVILLLPVSPIVMLAGFLFGIVNGFALIWVTGLLASSLAFWIGRSTARNWIERKIRNRTVFIAVDRAIERNGLWIVLLTRLAMVFPYGPLNYSLGLSSVRYRDYLIGTNIGMVPPFLLVAYLGSSAGSIAAMFSADIWPEGHRLFLGSLTLALVVLCTALIARSASRALRKELAESQKK